MTNACEVMVNPREEVSFRDPEGFADIFRSHYTQLLRFASRLTGEAEAADDVLQDVFLKLWDERHRLSIEVSLKALLYTMVRNRALNVLRQSNRFSPMTDHASTQLADPGPPDDDMVGVDELQRRIHSWIAELPPRRSEAFLLSRFHGLRHSEIAAVMDVSERTVETHILLALRHLRKRLDELHN